jgi:hypothetical protein
MIRSGANADAVEGRAKANRFTVLFCSGNLAPRGTSILPPADVPSPGTGRHHKARGVNPGEWCEPRVIQLRSLPGRLSGLHMVCLIYAAYKIIDPTADIGFDLAEEYALANQTRRDRRNS